MISAIRACLARDQLPSTRSRTSSRDGARHDRDAVVVADDDVAGHDDGVAAGDRDVDLARAVLVAAAGADGAAERGEAEFRMPSTSRIAPSTTMPPSFFAAAVWHINSPNTALTVAPAGVHDDHVARLGDLQRLVHHEIVGGRGTGR